MVFDLAACHIAVLALAALLLIFAAINDAQRYIIPNLSCIILLALFPVFILTSPHSIEWEQNVMVFVLVLIAGFVMFAKNIAGAGDIKLLAVTGLWAGPHLLALFLFITAIAGGLLSLVIAGLTYYRNRSRKASEVVALSKVPIPYGVAIAIGGLCTLVMLSHPILFSA